jgi:2-haloacid dehalogenase
MSAFLAGIFVDFYGTLVGGDREAVEAICAEIVASHGLARSPADLAAEWGARFFAQIEHANGADYHTLLECEGRSLRRTLEDHGIDADPRPYVRRLREYLRNPRLFPDVRDWLAGCRLPVCLVTNADRADLLAALDRLGLRFDRVVTSQDARSYKPDPGIFRYALARTGWPADRVVHVGDSLHSDVGGAARCGLRTVWLERPGRIGDVGRCESDCRIEDLGQLGSVIGAMNKEPPG